MSTEYFFDKGLAGNQETHPQILNKNEEYWPR